MCDYERERERLRAILAELDSEEEFVGGEDEDGEDLEIRSDHESDTEQELDFDDENLIDESDNHYTGKDGTIWKTKPFVQRRPRAENLFTVLPNLTNQSKNVKTPQESWNLFFSFVDQIVENTNIYITKQQINYRDVKNAQLTDTTEMNSLLGLLYLCGLHKSSHVYVRDLWAKDGTGFELFPATMSYGRFQFLMRCIRFDNIETRQERRQFDKLAPIREVFEKFNTNCQENYNVGCYVTVDEKLESFRGRCSFRQYIPNKPAKYGIKIFSAVDSTTFYTSKLEVYCGQQPDGPYNFCNKPEQIVNRITQHLQGVSRNITMDNWFTTHSLAENLLQKKTTLVGTIRKNKRVLPPEFTTGKYRQIKSTIFGYRKNATILSYVPKKNKCVLLLSTLHLDGHIISNQRSLPEIIEFYNKTKGGVDTTDQLCATYNVARNARRWPLVVFFSILNLSGINARIILLSTENPPLQYKKRSLFLKDLALSLIQAQIDRRSMCKTLPANVRSSCIKFASKTPANDLHQKPGTSQTNTITQPLPKKRKAEKQNRCQVCSYKSDRKTKTTCFKCDRYICGSHAISLCSDCYEKEDQTAIENPTSCDKL